MANDPLETSIENFGKLAFTVADDLVTLRKAVKPIIAAYVKKVDPGTSDLDDEQPFHITVTLGDLRQLDRLLRYPR